MVLKVFEPRYKALVREAIALAPADCNPVFGVVAVLADGYCPTSALAGGDVVWRQESERVGHHRRDQKLESGSAACRPIHHRY